MQIRYDLVTCFAVRPGPAGEPHEILQLRRSPGEFMAGAWSSVRGRIELGEKAWQAALRELREEAGLVPDSFYQLDTIDIFYLAAQDSILHSPGFCAVIGRESKVVLNEEHDDFRWVPRARIEQDFLWPGERAQLAELSREILDNGPAKAYLQIQI